MKLPSHLSIQNQHLIIGGCDTVKLAFTHGTPLYVTDETRIRDNYRRYVSVLSAHYPHFRILYAAKANGNLSILKILAQEGAGADVFSAGELHFALLAGMRPEHLLFNGSSKTEADHKLAVSKGVRVSLDSLDELAQLDLVAGEAGKVAEVSFRVNPAIEVPTHPKIATGLATSKFGIPAAEITDAYAAALACKNVVPVGIHCHIGSQILDTEPFKREAEVMMELVDELHRMGVKFKFIDLGGGLGVSYDHSESGPDAPTFENYASAVLPVCKSVLGRLGIQPEIWIEPGRSMVCDSTVLLTKVNSVKKAHKTFVNVDAGFNLLIRPAMYDSYHEVLVANRADEKPDGIYTVTGPICETGDILAHDRELPHVVSGDLVAILDTGAYGYSMASQYNGRGRCAEVLVRNGQAELMRRAETIDDLMATLKTPSWLD
ncbi:diaminopimelate decarboxylase [Methanospirillum sp.]|uniref:diaminopimelate decarboxylase n=1 Tax=Methanospirillum sp. TaxID=45200 RepID=UPI00359F1D63